MMSNQLELKVIFSAIDKFVRPVKHITEASRAASKALNDTKASMKGLTDQQKLVDKFKSTSKSVAILGQDLEKTRALAKKMGEELQRTEKPTVAMQKAFKHATEDVRNLAGTVNQMREQKQRLRQELAAAGVDTKALASHQQDLKGKLDAATDRYGLCQSGRCFNPTPDRHDGERWQSIRAVRPGRFVGEKTRH
jgi:phage-related tail protein